MRCIQCETCLLAVEHLHCLSEVQGCELPNVNRMAYMPVSRLESGLFRLLHVGSPQACLCPTVLHSSLSFELSSVFCCNSSPKVSE